MKTKSDGAFLRLGDHIHVAPVIHGSGDYAIAVRQWMLRQPFDCVAIPLPRSHQNAVCEAVTQLPTVTVVMHRTMADWQISDAVDEMDMDDNELLGNRSPGRLRSSYVPIDPCQPVIAAIRVAMGEHLDLHFIDFDSVGHTAEAFVMPDPYALKGTTIERFAASTFPYFGRPRLQHTLRRVHQMAARLVQLDKQYKSILFLCAIPEWPFVREAFQQLGRGESPGGVQPHNDEDDTDAGYEPTIVQPSEASLFFLLGELPFITACYERARADLMADENLSIDGVKELLIASRSAYTKEYGRRALTITPHTLSLCLRYVRNQTLLQRRLTPDLFTLAMSAKQVVGDRFALELVEIARTYGLGQQLADYEGVDAGIDQVRLPGGEIIRWVSRLPGPSIEWRRCELHRKPPRPDRQRWEMSWNPVAQCSWPPEDQRIEDFRTHVTDRAKAIIGADLARTEKFTTSVKDGIDVRDTLRNWHTGDIYVKVLPPSRGELDAVVMLFDVPADPREYPWRGHWFAEHQNESTLSFFATNYREEMVGPGIGLATYGGAMFLFPPVAIPDIWYDPRLDFCETLEERILAAACLHSACRQIALLCSAPPGIGWRRLAKRFGKRWVHVPLGHFGESTIQQLRMLHVLNGQQVRSYAAHFIRKT